MEEADTLSLIGRTIADKYAVESIVGQGGFAVVYRAMHLLWKRPVALKVFKALSDFSSKDRQRLLDEFIQEGQLLAELSERSSAIVQARDMGMLAGPDGEQVPYMVLEWLEGATLEAVIADERARKLPQRTIDEVIRLLDPAAEALALAHRKGIAHRDVKPANVFVLGDPRGEATVKLLDFGIAKVVSDAQKMAGTFHKTSGHVTSFTPAYGAPEQFSRANGATGPWTDVFALALIVGEMLSGGEALQGDDFLQLAVASANPARRPTPRALGAKVSDAVEEVFVKALSVNPTDRWPSAGPFWNALRTSVQMNPMVTMTDPMPGSARTAQPISTAATIAATGPLSARVGAVTGEPAAATAPRGTGGGGRTGMWVALGVVGVVGVGLGVRALASKPAEGSAPSPPSASAAVAAPLPPASSVAPAVAACPAGMIAIPGGSFFMGSDEGLPFERPAHQVSLAPYCVDKFEATVGDYKACSDAGRCKRAGTTNDWPTIADKERKAFDPLCNARDPVNRGRHPINCVDWEMSDKFCKEQGKRLPTEAEWEFAARGPDGRKYPWGDDDPGASRLNACGKECMLWGAKNGIEEKAMYDNDDGFANTAPVGSFPKGASRYGVEDVVGNVWEWVADWYSAYGKEEQNAPKGPENGDEKVIRGGAWNGSYPSWVRPTFRYKDTPAKRSYGIGFRCAK
ncbi:MAG TPA: bifunctional serine/threonine-protein kinase/formylglycine-generating enzyme family protein [Polyangiaceae bacterium]